MRISFKKMQAAGNDFVLIDNRQGAAGSLPDYAALARRLSDRKFGIGSDGLIVLEDPAESGLIMHYKNPDGSDAGMCGNGGRCFILFAHQLGYRGEIRFRVHDREYRGVLSDATDAAGNVLLHFPLQTQVRPVQLNGETLWQVYTNTEHLVCEVHPEELTDHPSLVKKGRTLRYHEMFAPSGTNVNFLAGRSPEELQLETYERGVEGLTLACGTGAIAATLAWHHLSGGASGSHTIRVRTSGGYLHVHFTRAAGSDTYNKISLEGPAVAVFEGVFYT